MQNCQAWGGFDPEPLSDSAAVPRWASGLLRNLRSHTPDIIASVINYFRFLTFNTTANIVRLLSRSEVFAFKLLE